MKARESEAAEPNRCRSRGVRERPVRSQGVESTPNSRELKVMWVLLQTAPDPLDVCRSVNLRLVRKDGRKLFDSEVATCAPKADKLVRQDGVGFRPTVGCGKQSWVAHMCAQGACKENTGAFLPGDARRKGRVQQLLPQVRKSREVVLEEQVVRVAHSRQSDEEHAGLRARCLTETHNCLRESHPLRLPRRERPGQAQRELNSMHVVFALGRSHHGQHRHPRATFWLDEKAGTFVLREIHEHVRRLATNHVVVVGMVARPVNDLFDYALAAVDQAVLDSEVVQQQHGSSHGEF